MTATKSFWKPADGSRVKRETFIELYEKLMKKMSVLYDVSMSGTDIASSAMIVITAHSKTPRGADFKISVADYSLFKIEVLEANADLSNLAWVLTKQGYIEVVIAPHHLYARLRNKVVDEIFYTRSDVTSKMLTFRSRGVASVRAGVARADFDTFRHTAGAVLNKGSQVKVEYVPVTDQMLIDMFEMWEPKMLHIWLKGIQRENDLFVTEKQRLTRLVLDYLENK